MQSLKNTAEKILIKIFSFLLWLAIVAINKTVKIIYQEEMPLDVVRKKGNQLIYALWHGQTFTPFYFMHKKGDDMVLLTTAARRGQVLNGAISRLGYEIVSLPGFTPSRAWLTELMNVVALIKKGYDAGFVLDGPFGPAGVIKPGVFLASAKSGAAIIPVGVFYQRSFSMFWRWDKYQIPWPFSNAVIICGEPLYFQEKISSENIEMSRQELYRRLTELNHQAKTLARQRASN